MGMRIEFANHLVVFGDKQDFSFEDLKREHGFSMCQLKQVHGNVVEKADSERELTCDGHWTTSAQKALVIKTADCVPLFFFDSQSSFCCGLHVGWRGLASKIVAYAMNVAKVQASDIAKLTAVIGPHIQMRSFEVDEGTCFQLLKSAGPSKNRFYSELPNKKYHVDLNGILVSQLQEHGIVNIVNLQIDTFTNKEFHSFRRDKELAGRQLSFIACLGHEKHLK